MIKQIITISTLTCFIFCFICSEPLQAILDQQIAAPRAVQFEEPVIPPGSGKITDGKNIGSKQLVINIQDLHCHPEVQRNIAKILSALDKEYGLESVYVEGGYGKVDTSWLSDIVNNDLKTKIVESLVDEGRLTGAEYYSVMANRPRVLQGLEDEALHKANIARLGKIVDKKNFFESRIRGLDKDLAFMTAKHFGGRNKRFSRLIEKYRNGKVSSEKYYTTLGRHVTAINDNPGSYNTLFSIQLDSYPDIKSYIKLSRTGRQLNYKKAAREMQSFLGELKSSLSYGEYDALLEKTAHFARLDELYFHLSSIARDHRFNLAARYPSLAEFLVYTEQCRTLNPLRMVDEEKKLTAEMRMGFSRSTAELDVAFLADFYPCFKDFLLSRLSADDYEYFRLRFEKFKTTWLKYAFNDRIADLSDEYRLLDEFYSANCERNRCFLHRINELSDVCITENKEHTADITALPTSELSGLLQHSDVVVMVTGGFHTEGLKKLLAGRGISYLTITPNVTKDTAFSSAMYTRLVREQSKILSNAMQLGLLSQTSINTKYKVALEAVDTDQIPAILAVMKETTGISGKYDKDTGIVTLDNGAQVRLESKTGHLEAHKIRHGHTISTAVKSAIDQLIGTGKVASAVAKALGGDIDDFMIIVLKMAAEYCLITGNGLSYGIVNDPALSQMDAVNGMQKEILARFPEAAQEAIAGYQENEFKLNDAAQRDEWLKVILAIDLLRDFIPRVTAVDEFTPPSPSETQLIITKEAKNTASVPHILSETSPSPLAGQLMRNHQGYFAPGKTLLSLGAGNGNDEQYFAAAGLKVTAADNNPEILTHLKDKADKGPHFAVEYSDATKELPFSDASFDIVYVRLVLHYFDDAAQGRALREIRRVLKTGGVAVIQVKTPDDELYKKEKERLSNGMFYFPSKDFSRNHISREDLEKKIVAAGLRPLKSKKHKERLYTDLHKSALATVLSIKESQESVSQNYDSRSPEKNPVPVTLALQEEEELGRFDAPQPLPDAKATEHVLLDGLAIGNAHTVRARRAISEAARDFRGSGKFAFVLIGSAGLGQMCSKSDIDYVLVHDDMLTQEELKRLVNAVDQAVLKEGFGPMSSFATGTIDSIARDVKISVLDRLSMNNMSFACGDHGLYEKLEKEIQFDSSGLSRVEKDDLLLKEYLLNRRLRNHPGYDSEYPDVKLGQGGIRDIQHIQLMSKIEYGHTEMNLSNTIDKLVREEVVSREEADGFMDAVKFIFAVRDQMHRITGEERDVLTQELQKSVTENLSFNDQINFMRVYRRHGKVIAEIADKLRKEILEDVGSRKGVRWARMFHDAMSTDQPKEAHKKLLEKGDAILALAAAWSCPYSDILEKIFEKYDGDWSILYALANSRYSSRTVFEKLLAYKDRGNGYRMIVRDVALNRNVPISLLQSILTENGFDSMAAGFAEANIIRSTDEGKDLKYSMSMEEPIKRASALGKRRIVIGVPFYQEEEETVGNVVRQVILGLQESYSEKEFVVVCVGRKHDRTDKIIAAINEIGSESHADTIVYTLEPVGKGLAMRSVMEIAELLDAEGCAFIDADERSITKDWAPLLIDPLLMQGYDFVSARYKRHHHSATITNHLVYPLISALYGKAVRQPIGGEFAFSRGMIRKYLQDPTVWYTNIGAYGVDNWMTTTALVNGNKMCEVDLGVKVHAFSAYDKRESMFQQVAKEVFKLAKKNKGYWQQARGNDPSQIVGPLQDLVPAANPPNYAQWIERAKHNYAMYGDVYDGIVSPEKMSDLKKVFAADIEGFNFSNEIWVNALYDFIIAYSFKAGVQDDDRFWGALVALWQARVGSFIKHTQCMSFEEAEMIINQQVESFKEEKEAFLEKWQQNEYFSRYPKIEIINPNLTADIQVAVFDWDGTIMHLLPDWKVIITEILQEILSGEGSALPFYLGASGVITTALQVAEESNTAHKNELLYTQDYIRAMNRMVDVKRSSELLIKGAKEFIATLHQANVQLFVLTGGFTEEKVHQAGKLNVREYFVNVIGRSPGRAHEADILEFKKDQLREIKFTCGVSDDQLVVFGDSPSDIKAAKAIGAVAVGIAQGEHSRNELIKEGVDIIINGDYSDIREELAGILIQQKPVGIFEHTVQPGMPPVLVSERYDRISPLTHSITYLFGIWFFGLFGWRPADKADKSKKERATELIVAPLFFPDILLHSADILTGKETNSYRRWGAAAIWCMTALAIAAAVGMGYCTPGETLVVAYLANAFTHFFYNYFFGSGTRADAPLTHANDAANNSEKSGYSNDKRRGMIPVYHISRSEKLRNGIERYHNGSEYMDIWFTDLPSDGGEGRGLLPFGFNVIIDGKQIETWAGIMKGAPVFYMDLKKAGIPEGGYAQSLSRGASQITAYLSGTDNVQGFSEVQRLFTRMGISLQDSAGLKPVMIIDHTGYADNVKKVFSESGINMIPVFAVDDLENTPAADLDTAIRKRLIRQNALAAVMSENKILKMDISDIDGFLRELDVFNAVGNGQMLVNWQIFENEMTGKHLSEKQLRALLADAREHGVMVHCEYGAAEATDAADIKRLYDLGFHGVDLNLSRVNVTRAVQLLDALEECTLIAVTMPNGLPSPVPKVAVRLNEVKGMKFAVNDVIDVTVPRGLTGSQIADSLQYLLLENTIILHSKDARDLIGASRDIVDKKAFASLFALLGNFGKAGITTPETARRLGYRWSADDLPKLVEGEAGRRQVQALCAGTLEGTGISADSAIANQAAELTTGSLKQAFLAAIAEKALIKKRLLQENKKVAAEYSRDTCRLCDPLYEEMLGAAMLRELLMHPEDRKKDRQAAALLKTGAKDNLTSLLMKLHGDIKAGKQQLGAVTVVIDAVLCDIAIDNSKKKSVIERAGNIDTKYYNKVLSAA